MARPKGSKNKTTLKIDEEHIIGNAGDGKGTRMIERSELTSPESWKPEPNMGAIKPPPPEVKACANCGDKNADHYGTPKRWCNVRGCNCQGFVG